jgi:hypothetical protein
MAIMLERYNMQIRLTGQELTNMVRTYITLKTGLENPMKVLLVDASPNVNTPIEMLAKYFSVIVDIQETPEVK